MPKGLGGQTVPITLYMYMLYTSKSAVGIIYRVGGVSLIKHAI